MRMPGAYRPARRCAALLLALLAVAGPLVADDRGLFSYARALFLEGDYYNAVTELKRYQCLYPSGADYRRSLLLTGEAYFRGGDIARGAEVMETCAMEFSGSSDGQEALYILAGIRIMEGLPVNALAVVRRYRNGYPGGERRESVDLVACYAAALTGDMDRTLAEIREFRERYRQGALDTRAAALEEMVAVEALRPRKSVFLAVAGSLVIPGFGYFYTGHYMKGTLSFFSNALLIFLIYNAVRRDNTFQIVCFSLLEASFYQYSLYGAMRSVREYNGSEEFYRRVTLSFGASF
jgi:hypothetical protein